MINQTKFYFAPLEGLTDPKFRTIHAKLTKPYGGSPDRYYAPFFSPTFDTILSDRDAARISPDSNPDMFLVPQIMTNQASLFLAAAEELAHRGFLEVNLNLGCPSGTVVSKKRGAGFLSDPDALDRFFDEIFEKGLPETSDGTPIHFSVKSRLGMFSADEFKEIFAIYNRYPIDELILHPRVRAELYRGQPHLDLFKKALLESSCPMCYNSNIFTIQDFEVLCKALKPVGKPFSVMLGRGLVSNPFLVRELRGGNPLQKEELYSFYQQLFADARERLSGERHILFRMKELWAYWMPMFENVKSYHKRLRKTESLTEFEAVSNAIFDHCSLKEHAGFSGNGELDLE